VDFTLLAILFFHIMICLDGKFAAHSVRLWQNSVFCRDTVFVEILFFGETLSFDETLFWQDIVF
jgi:hypothetical protein